MIQPVRGANPQLGYFFRGASQVVQPRTLRGIGRFVLGLIFAAFDRSVAGIRDAVADAPTAAALREFLRSKTLTPKLVRLLDWKTRQLVRKALRCPKNRRGPIVFAIDSTFKGTLSRLARHLFSVGKGDRVGNHIFVWGVLVFPDGRRLPLRARLKRKGSRAATQVDLAAALVRDLATSLRGHPVVVVADSFFFSRKLLKAIRAAKFHYVLACKGNTVLSDGADLEWLRRNVRLTDACVTLPAARGERSQTYSAARRVLPLRCGGTQAVVFSRLAHKPRAAVKFLASDLVDASAAELVRLYALRWQIEVFFREAKMYLGLDQYRVTGDAAPENFALLVALAYQFLHWRIEGTGRLVGTLTQLKAFADEVAADNVAAIERGALTRHGRKKLHERLRRHRRPCAHGSRSARNPRPKVRKVV
jgi:hypothetical protein